MTSQKPVIVRDAMHHETPVIDGLATVSDALTLLSSTSQRALIIEKRDEYDEYGVVDINQIAAEVIAPNRNPDRVSVYEVMIKPVVTVSVEMQAKYAIRLLSRLRLDHAIAMDGEKMAGLVSLQDLVLISARVKPVV